MRYKSHTEVGVSLLLGLSVTVLININQVMADCEENVVVNTCLSRGPPICSVAGQSDDTSLEESWIADEGSKKGHLLTVSTKELYKTVWEEGLGTDSCPECKQPLANFNTRVTELGSSAGLGVDMCPECRQIFATPEAIIPDLGPESLGFDSCPVCRHPGMTTARKVADLEAESLGVDMCPECRQPFTIPETIIPDLGPESLGVDSCPECRQYGTKTAKRVTDLNVESLGVDMCPECRQSVMKNEITPTELENAEGPGAGLRPERLILSPTPDLSSTVESSNSLMEVLQDLVAAQKSQLDQFGELLNRFQVTFNCLEPFKDEEGTENSAVGLEAASNLGNIGAKMDRNKVDKNERSPQLKSINDLGPDDSLAETTDADEISPVIQRVEPAKRGVRNGKGDGTGNGGMTVARYRPAWSEYFQFLSAVKVDGEVSCLHILPHEAEDGTSRYIAVGDMTGRVYLFIWLGDLLLEYSTISSSPVTVMLSYTVSKNETFLVTGHSDGTVLVHQLLESQRQGLSSGDDFKTISSMEFLYALVFSPAGGPSRSDGAHVNYGKHDSNLIEQEAETVTSEEDSVMSAESKSVLNLEMYRVGKIRYILVSDMEGSIQVFRENGSLYGVAVSPSRPLAFLRNPSAQRLLFLTEVGVGSLDLRSMLVRSGPCEGLNTSIVVAYAFDVAGRSRANGFTADGDLVHVTLSGDVFHFECIVKKRRKVEAQGPYSPSAIKGYLLVATSDDILIFNTSQRLGFTYSNSVSGEPKPIFSASLNEVSSSFVSTPIPKSVWPVIACNRDKLVVIGFGQGYVGIFRCTLPTQRPADFGSKLWSSPILIGMIVLLGVWQLFNLKRGETTRAADHIDPLQSPSPSPVTTSNYRALENSRLGLGERDRERGRERESLGSESVRYRSPSRGFVVGNQNPNPPYGAGSMNFLSLSSDPGSYSTRREPLFSSTDVVENRQDEE